MIEDIDQRQEYEESVKADEKALKLEENLKLLSVKEKEKVCTYVINV